MSINIQFPLTTGPQGAFATNDTTIEAVADDLLILLLTNHGERPIHFDFGANLRSLLFEQRGPDFSLQAQDLITVAVGKWMPFVTIRNVQVLTSEETATLKSNEIHIKLDFAVGQESGQLNRRVVL